MMVPCRVFKLWRPHKWNTRNQLFPLHLKKVERLIKEMGKRRKILCFWEFHKVNFYSCLIFPCNYLIYIRTYRYIYTGCRKRLSVVVYFDDPNSRCTEIELELLDKERNNHHMYILLFRWPRYWVLPRDRRWAGRSDGEWPERRPFQWRLLHSVKCGH